MMTIHEGVFELFVVKDEYATEAQVAQALKEQRKRKKKGAKVRLDELMVELGHLEETEADEIRDRLDDEIIPGYRLHEELGRGGMGTVYRATQLSMERDVAVKVLSRRLSKDKKFCKKFLQEARNAAKLNHENIMGGIDCGESNGLHYFVMEYVPGESLVDQIDRDGPLSIDRAFYLLEQVGRGLKHAHGQKIVHRDIKPENIMLTKEGVVKICDLGLAKPEIKAGEGVKGGTCEGTPYYCAPEQALGRTDIDVKADVYALGASMFHLLTNRTPFDGESARAILWQQVNTPFPDWKTEVPDLSSDQRRLLEDMVIKKRENRLASMDELLERLQALKIAANMPKGPSRRLQPLASGQGGLPLIPIAVAVLLVLGIVGGVIAMNSGNTDEEPIAKVTDTDPQPKETKRRPIKLTEVPKPEPKDDKTPKVDDEAAKLLRQANRLFQEAKDFETANPDNPQLAMVKFRNVVDQFPGTNPAIRAASQVQRLTKKSQKLVANKWGQLVKDIDTKRSKGLYKQAMAAIESFNESYDTRLLNPYQRRMDKKRKDILAMIQRDIDSLGSQLRDWADDTEKDDPEQYKKIDQLKENCPENTHAKLEDLRKE
ncbi:MAG: serine/threonine-protein kinase, partial [Planctomycetota bacterium]|nr:serine/threonine-protein kinase [Planctomycetota bacterium]